jgi:hypothetical protein
MKEEQPDLQSCKILCSASQHTQGMCCFLLTPSLVACADSITRLNSESTNDFSCTVQSRKDVACIHDTNTRHIRQQAMQKKLCILYLFIYINHSFLLHWKFLTKFQILHAKFFLLGNPKFKFCSGNGLFRIKSAKLIISTLKKRSWYYMKLANDRHITHHSQFVIDRKSYHSILQNLSCWNCCSVQ